MRRSKILQDFENGPERNAWDPHDHKQEWVEDQQRQQRESTDGWLYVGMEHGRSDRAKIGLTTGSPSTRDSSSQNPEYDLYSAFKFKHGLDGDTIRKVEAGIKTILSDKHGAVPRASTGKATEFYPISPAEMRDQVRDWLADCHREFMYGFECPERGYVINEWENERVIHERANNGPYLASDVSNPPVAFECRMPPGCGAEDCDCWPSR